MSDPVPALSSYFTISKRNVAISGASAAAIGYLLYRGELDESRLARMVSDVSQAVQAGANVWHTISSLTIFRSIPRHNFSAVQASLFPSYFTFLHGLSGVSLAVYLAQPSTQHHHAVKFRLTCLIVSHATSALNAIFLGPTLSKLNAEVIAMEFQAGVGQREGPLTDEEKTMVVAKCPQYKITHRRFAILHGINVLFAMAGYACNLANVAVTAL